MKYVQMYSYKGGSGRTVATANVAKILADKGYRVLVIDLDSESAGLSYVFEIKRSKKNIIRTQDILSNIYYDRAGNKKDGLRRDYLDPANFMDTWKTLHFELDDNLWFIPARYSSLPVLSMAQSNNLGKFLDRLKMCLKVSNIGEPDFVLFDSPSGLQEWARRIFEKGILVVFFRWSKQFTKGTLRFLDDRLTKRKSIPSSTIVIPNAVPNEVEFQNSEEKEDSLKNIYINDFRGKIKSIKFRIERREDQEEPLHFIENGIPECPILKWDETIFAGKTTLGEYEKNTLAGYKLLAEQLIAIKDESENKE